MAFRVGQKVVCVDASPGRHGYAPRYVNEGEVYTVSRLTISNDGPALRLIEVNFDPLDWLLCHRFRPVVEKSTDTGMAILREILDRETIKDDKPVRVS